MNHNLKIDLKHSTSKPQMWNKGIIVGLILSIGIINFGCDNCKCDEVNSIDEYYVKYEVNSTTIYTGSKLNVIIKTENNTNMTITINQNILWETIIGPVPKGFSGSLNVSATAETYNQLRLYTNIYVSKNSDPFALKKSDGSETPRDNVQINYTIE
jgi:hypothetical protein